LPSDGFRRIPLRCLESARGDANNTQITTGLWFGAPLRQRPLLGVGVLERPLRHILYWTCKPRIGVWDKLPGDVERLVLLFSDASRVELI